MLNCDDIVHIIIILCKDVSDDRDDLIAADSYFLDGRCYESISWFTENPVEWSDVAMVSVLGLPKPKSFGFSRKLAKTDFYFLAKKMLTTSLIFRFE